MWKLLTAQVGADVLVNVIPVLVAYPDVIQTVVWRTWVFTPKIILVPKLRIILQLKLNLLDHIWSDVA
jgi:hypothetical protein